MSHRRHHHRRRAPILVPVASMGDIAFLLIIFFMICSNLPKNAPIEAEPPISRQIDKLEDSLLIVAIDKNAKLYLQGRPIASSKAIQSQLAVLLEGRTGPGATTVLFKCDRTVHDPTVYVPVLYAIQQAGGTIAAVGERPSPQP